MRLRYLIGGLGVASAATLLYGMLVEAERLVLEKPVLRLPRWPERLSGFRVGLIADCHLRDRHTVGLTRRAVRAVLGEGPDVVVLAGDLIAYWRPDVPWLVEEALQDLLPVAEDVIAIAGNHEYWGGGGPELMRRILETLGFRFLVNELLWHKGVAWLGIDSANAGRPEPERLFSDLQPGEAAVALWHEPDCADLLPDGAALMLSGHSHGGQFTFPWGWTPMHTRNGEKYVRGFHPEAPTPVYVSRGLGTTGYPSRLGCPPEATVLTLLPA
ncbi:MAG: metallophosphoesterase [Fimbriimonadales bacterium]|nr:metallophosphoesterase [Fimbriimonadales bacterium]